GIARSHRCSDASLDGQPVTDLAIHGNDRLMLFAAPHRALSLYSPTDRSLGIGPISDCIERLRSLSVSALETHVADHRAFPDRPAEDQPNCSSVAAAVPTDLIFGGRTGVQIVGVKQP